MHLKKDGEESVRPESQSSESFVDGSTRYFETDHLLADISRRTVRGGVVTMLSHGLKFVVGIIATAILARLLTPQDYGLVGMVAVATNFVSMLKDMGLSYPTVQRAEIDFNQISMLFWVNIGISLALVAVIVAIAPAISWFYEEPRLTMIAVVTAIGFLFGGLTVQHEALLRRQMRFFALSAIAFLSMLAGYIAGITMAWYGAGYWSLVVAQLTLLGTSALGVFTVCSWRPGLPRWGSGAKSMLTFGGNVTGYAAINYFSKNLDNLLIGKFWGAQNLGLFSKAGQLVSLPSDQIDEPLSTVALPVLSRLGDSPERYRRVYLRMLEKVMLLTMPAITLVIVSADWLVRLVLGSQWTGAARIVFFLGIAALLQPVLNTMGWLFLSQGRAREMFHWSLINAPISIVSIVCGLPWGAVGVAASYSLTRVIVVNPLMYWFVGRSGPVRTRDLYGQVVPFILASTAALLACLAFRQLVSLNGVLVNIAASGIIIAVTTLGFLLLFPTGRRALLDVKYLLLFLKPHSPLDRGSAPR
jgi:O-antigen/teichoic acid export membrane protein